MSPTVDFLRPRRGPRVGYGLLATGLVALAAAVGLDRQWAAERADRQAAAQAREEAALQAQRAALQTAPPSAEEMRLRGVAPRLREPWLPSLRLIENATQPPVFLLGLSIDPAHGSLRIDGEAATFDQVVAYVSQLNEPGLMGPAELRSHEQVAGAAGRSTVRFTVQTRWSAR